MPERTCSVDGCCAPHRARGLCSTHYNQQRQPNRHRKSTVACTVCGAPTLKAKRARHKPVCSMTCRWFLQNPILSCPIPRTHPAHPDFGRPTSRQLRKLRLEAARQADIAELMHPRACDDCGTSYAPGTTVQRYCSALCLRRVERRKRKALEHGAQGSYTWTQVIGLFLLFDRCCAYCAEPIVGQPDPDHVVPLSRGGHNGISNILPACRACNCDKRDVLIEEWNADRARRGLPSRITRWSYTDRRYAHLSPSLRVTAAW